MSPSGKICQLCCNPLGTVAKRNKSVEKVKENLWRFLYHESLQEAVSPSGLFSNTASVSVGGTNSQNVKLTFALTVDTQNAGENPAARAQFAVCQRCEMELESLSKLHQSLEETKRKMREQVKTIEKIRKIADLKIPGSRKNLEVQNLSGLQMVFGGATMGVENVLQTLSFLGKMCEQFPSSPGASQDTQVPSSSKQHVPIGESEDCDFADDPDIELSEPPIKINSAGSIITDSSDMYTDMDISTAAFSVKVDTDNISEVLLEDNNFLTELDELAGHPDLDPLASSFDNQPHQQVGMVAPEVKTPKIVKIITVAKPKPIQQQFLHASSSKTIKKKYVKKTVMKQCTVCDKVMVSNNYAQHMRLHTGEKPYKCNICGAEYAQKPSYNHHVKWGHSTTKRPQKQKAVVEVQVQDVDPLAID